MGKEIGEFRAGRRIPTKIYSHCDNEKPTKTISIPPKKPKDRIIFILPSTPFTLPILHSIFLATSVGLVLDRSR